MGGDYYDRDVGVSTGTSGGGSSQANTVLSQSFLHKSCDPKRWCDEKLESDAKNPIVFALDVTGSMGEWTKIIYDKMPMFYGQIMMKNYLEDPSISFCAIGDHGGDNAPLQCTEFGRGKEIDQLISRIYLEGNGQGNGIEGYEMSTYFYDTRVTLLNCQIPFMFITGDESYYDEVSPDVVLGLLGVPVKDKICGKTAIQNAMKKYNLFIVKKHYDDTSIKKWTSALGSERVLNIKTPKACVDIILGAIALTSGARTLDEYIKDLVERGQSDDRVVEVTEALKPYWEKIVKQQVTIIRYEKPLTLDEVTKKSQEIRGDLYKDKADKRDKLYEKLGSGFPKEFVCPITKRVLIDAVITSDGETFERESIKLYLKQGVKENPFTGEKIEDVLTPNTILQKMIDDYVNKHSV